MIIKSAWNDISYRITMFVAGTIRDLLYKKIRDLYNFFSPIYTKISTGDYLFNLYMEKQSLSIKFGCESILKRRKS